MSDARIIEKLDEIRDGLVADNEKLRARVAQEEERALSWRKAAGEELDRANGFERRLAALEAAGKDAEERHADTKAVLIVQVNKKQKRIGALEEELAKYKARTDD